jgi:diacylglycerol kinase family enzyme
VSALFDAAGVQADVTVAADGAALVQAARRALAAAPDLIVAGGGDGTMNAVASVLVGTGVPLGVLPLGTLNHFAKDLGVPLTLPDAVRTAVHGRLVHIDVGEVNGRVFLNNSSLGLYADIVRDRERQQRRLGRGKWVAAAWATVAALRRYPFLDLRLCADGRVHVRRTPFVFIGNNEYRMDALAIGARGSLTEGKLSLYVAQRPGRLGLLRFALRAVCGRLAQARDFDALLVETVDIAARHAHLLVATDGEVARMATPLRYRVRPGVLAVRVAAAKPSATA